MSSASVNSILVVGGGVLGSSVAYHLAKAGAQVTLIEQHTIAAKASSNSYGWINATAAESSDYYDLRTQAIVDYRNLLNEYSGIESLSKTINFSGSLWWETPGRDLIELHDQLHNYGHAVRKIDREEFVKIEPNVANPPEVCLYSQNDGAAEGAALARFFASTAATLGSKVLTGVEFESLVIEDGEVTGVMTSHGKFAADSVVLATGTATARLTENTGFHVPMDNQQGLIVHTQPTEPVITSVINAEDIHFRQAADGHIVMGEIFSGGTLGACSGQTPEQFAQLLLTRLKDRLPSVRELAIEQVHLGVRPVPVDGYPIVGMPGNMPGLYILTTHSGITLAPLLGRLVAEELLFGERSALLAPYHPSRFC